MSKQVRRYRLDPDPKLNPSEVSIELAWDVDGEGEVDNVSTLPGQDMEDPWPVREVCQVHKLALIPGHYHISGEADGVVRVISLPQNISDHDRRTLIKAFGEAFQNDVRQVSDLLGRLPTDVQILDAAQVAVREVIVNICKSLFEADPETDPVEQSALASMSPGFIKVAPRSPKDMSWKVACDELPDQLKDAVHRLRIRIDALAATDSHSLGDHGQFEVHSDDRAGHLVSVGFVKESDSQYGVGLNLMLAQRFRQAIKLVERDVVSDFIHDTSRKVRVAMIMNTKLAEMYKIERLE